MDSRERWPSFQRVREQEGELAEEQQAEVNRFTQTRIATMLSTSEADELETEAEIYLRQAYGIVGLESPKIRWFDSPISFALVPEHAPHNLELLLRTSVEARVAATITEQVSVSLWSALNGSLEVVGEGVWYTVGRMIEEAALAHFKQSPLRYANVKPDWAELKNSIQSHIWDAARATYWEDEFPPPGHLYGNARFRVYDGAQAYRSAFWLAQAMMYAHIIGPNDLVHFARFNELVSGYRLGREEAWLVRKPEYIARDAQGCLHADDGMCLRYRDGWGFYAWHGHRVSEKLILHPEQITLDDWIQEPDRFIQQAIQERIGHRRFSEMAGGLRVDEKDELVVDLDDRALPTGYFLIHRGNAPIVCHFPANFLQHYCAQRCVQHRPCPDVSELLIKQQKAPGEQPGAE